MKKRKNILYDKRYNKKLEESIEYDEDYTNEESEEEYNDENEEFYEEEYEEDFDDEDEDEDEDDDDEYEYVDYEDLSLKELQEICEDREINIKERYSKEKLIELLEEYDEDLEDEDISIGISDFSFKLLSIILFILIFIIVFILCKEIIFTKEIEIDKTGNEYMNVKTMALNSYEEGKNEKVENFFTKNIKVNDRLSKKDKEFLDDIFKNEDIKSEEDFEEAAKEALSYLVHKNIISTNTKYAYEGKCTLVNPLNECEVNYLYVDINYDKKDTFFIWDDELTITYIIL